MLTLPYTTLELLNASLLLNSTMFVLVISRQQIGQ